MTTAQRRRSGMAPPLETPMHIAVADLLRLALSPGWLWFHVPNGEERSAFINAKGKRVSPAAGRLKRMGVMPGVSDILLIAPEGAQLHALELKRKHKSPTSDQLDFLQSVIACGGKSAWADSFEDAAEILQSWSAIRSIHL